jgi:hypothetical protein
MKIFRRKKFESDMAAELGFHIDAYVEDLIRSGINRNEFQRRARLEFGAIEATKTNTAKPGDHSGWTSCGRTCA